MTAAPEELLARWDGFAGGTATPFGNGLINDTFLVERDGRRCVLQRLHPVFSPLVHHDIEAVTAHLAAKGVTTPRLLRTNDGALWVERATAERNEVWRAQTFIEGGTSFDRVDGAARAFAAGALVGRFHGALADLHHFYRAARAGVHDTAKHLATLAEALDAHPAHRLRDEVGALADEIVAAGRALPDLTALTKRHAHGDLKLSNLLFDARGDGLCLVDLDTVGAMILPFELGDALRSWCNPAGEDDARCAVDVDVFTAALRGYGSTATMAPEDRDALVDGVFTICTELAARFAADAHNERYFGWNPQRHAGRGEHNLLRARGQWSLAKSVRARRGELDGAVRAALGG